MPTKLAPRFLNRTYISKECKSHKTSIHNTCKGYDTVNWLLFYSVDQCTCDCHQQIKRHNQRHNNNSAFCWCDHLKEVHNEDGCMSLVHGLDFDGLPDEPCVCRSYYAK